MNYTQEAIEACEALAHPLPHPTMHMYDHSASIDTARHPGPITMYEPDTKPILDVYGLVLIVGILSGFGLVFAGGQIAELAVMSCR
jgi:hypothetical protein